MKNINGGSFICICWNGEYIDVSNCYYHVCDYICSDDLNSLGNKCDG